MSNPDRYAGYRKSSYCSYLESDMSAKNFPHGTLYASEGNYGNYGNSGEGP
jgi:hypothetical protein